MMRNILDEINSKLKQLNELDSHRELDASRFHNYTFPSCASHEKIAQFEWNHHIKLPEPFVAFYTTFGNGGPSSDRSLYSLEKIAEFIDPQKIQQRFPLTKAYYAKKTNKIQFEDAPLPGVIYIGDQGKGVYCILVINGPETGTIWIDSRGGINEEKTPVIYPRKPISVRFKGKAELSFPEWYKSQRKLTFLEWYLDWIEADLEEILRIKERQNTILQQITEDSKEINLKNFYLETLPLLPEKLPFVEKINLTGNPLISLKGLPNTLPNAKTFFFIEMHLSTLQYFPQNVPNLDFLNLNGNPIKNLIGLPSNMPKLDYFHLQNCPLEVLQGFPQTCPLLSQLILSNTQLKNLDYLPSSLPNLQTLYLENCHLDNIKGLPCDLPKLEEIYLKGGTVKDLTGILDSIKAKIKWN